MTWGLALSAGSALGMANAGILERLEEEGLRPDAVAASSMGAIIGALYALEHPPSVYHAIARKVRLWNVARASDRFLKGGLHGGLFRQRLREHLKPYIGSATIADCAIPFLCVAGRVKEPIRWERIVEEGFGDYVASCLEPHVFPPATRVMDAIMASSAIPVVFSPVTIGGETFVDICNFGAIPVQPLRERFDPDVIIATHTMPSYAGLKKMGPPFLRRWLELNERLLLKSLEGADLVIAPRPAAPSFRFDRFDAFIKAGRRAADDAMPRVKQLLTPPLWKRIWFVARHGVHSVLHAGKAR